jgi:hypothetical protein
VAEIPSQSVEYLSVNQGLLGDPAIGEPVVIITIRPEPLESFEVVNLAIPMPQAQRLLADLTNLLMPFVLLLGLLAATIGCGARVDVGSKRWGSASGEIAKTAVEVVLLQPRPPEAVIKTDPPAAKTPKRPIQPPSSPPKSVPPEVKPINFSGNTFVFNYRAGDVTYRSESHIHVHEPPPRVQERVIVHREVEPRPPRRPIEDPCDRGQREHEERVRRWRQFPKGY